MADLRQKSNKNNKTKSPFTKFVERGIKLIFDKTLIPPLVIFALIKTILMVFAVKNTSIEVCDGLLLMSLPIHPPAKKDELFKSVVLPKGFPLPSNEIDFESPLPRGWKRVSDNVKITAEWLEYLELKIRSETAQMEIDYANCFGTGLAHRMKRLYE